MSNGRQSSSANNELTDSDLSKMISLLTGDLADIEKCMIDAWLHGVTKISRVLREQYQLGINDLIKRLRNIGSTLFHETSISKVKTYKSNEKIPENYKHYLDVSANLAKLVTHDILFKPDLIHAVAALDRWIYLCKIAFHQHDFFTASCILNGINSSDVSIESILSKQSQCLLIYYRNVMAEVALIYHRQNELSKHKLDVVPSLHVLSHMYAKLDFKPSVNQKRDSFNAVEIKVRRRAVSKSFSLIKKKDSAQLDDEEAVILHSLYKSEPSEQSANFKKLAKEFKKLILYDTSISAGRSGSLSGFSVATYSDLTDLRVELILLKDYIASLEDVYGGGYNTILYEVKSILGNAELTDKHMLSRIYLTFRLTDLDLDDTFKYIYDKSTQLLADLIKYEQTHARLVEDNELRLADTTEATKEKIRRGRRIRDKSKAIDNSTKATEERSTQEKLGQDQQNLTAVLLAVPANIEMVSPSLNNHPQELYLKHRGSESIRFFNSPRNMDITSRSSDSSPKKLGPDEDKLEKSTLSS